MATAVNVAAPAAPQWARKYPPLLALGAALLLAIVVLPSSLNLPQSNPTTTLELAPVPPTDEATPPIGNFSSLGLGTSSGIKGGGAAGGEGAGGADDDTLGLPTAPGRSGKGRTPQTKRCVGKPPRQTEDPLSPPCVASFEGDNGGATYQGVTKDEVRILFYYDPGVYTPTARGQDTTPDNQLIDLDEPPKDDEIGLVTVTREWAKYFEFRYQTYNRHAHLYIYFGSATYPATPESRQADAAQAYSLVKPFATISSTGLSGSSDDFIKFMARRGVLNFGSLSGRQGSFFVQFPKLLWGYPPSLDQQAEGFVDFVCKKVVPYPVSSGEIDRGGPRKLGLVYTDDESYPNLKVFKDRVKEGIEKCGGKFVATATYPRNGFTTDGSQTPAYAINNMATFANAGVTTIIWPGGSEIKMSQAAGTRRYFPEWVIAGDTLQESVIYGQRQDQDAWHDHAWVVTPQVRVGLAEQELCYQAYREIDTQAPTTDVTGFACGQYNDLRQLFTGIQVAGPKLGPTSIDKGFHAIPSIESPDPRVPACFYEVSDYTCVKDSQAMFWDRNAIAPNYPNPNQPGSGSGCWRMALGGKRFINKQWPSGDMRGTLYSGDLKTAPCNGYDSTEYIDTGA